MRNFTDTLKPKPLTDAEKARFASMSAIAEAEGRTDPYYIDHSRDAHVAECEPCRLTREDTLRQRRMRDEGLTCDCGCRGA